MTGVVSVCWHVTPASPPIPLRHCSACRRTRPFQSSGKIRLNANGRKLDAWLIYKCQHCDRSWNRPIFERVDVRSFEACTLRAMHHSDRAWVHRIEGNVATLKHHCDQVLYDATAIVNKPPPVTLPSDWQRIALVIRGSAAGAPRLDRLLAQELQWSRSTLGALVQRGELCVAPSPKSLRKPLRSEARIEMSRPILNHMDPQTLQRCLFM